MFDFFSNMICHEHIVIKEIKLGLKLIAGCFLSLKTMIPPLVYMGVADWARPRALVLAKACSFKSALPSASPR